jgi:hypothetical protein
VDTNTPSITDLARQVGRNAAGIADLNARLDALGGGLGSLGAAIGEVRGAMGMAMDAPYVPPDRDFCLNVAAGHYSGSRAFALSGAWRLGTDVQMVVGLGATRSHHGGRVGVAWAR